MVRPARWSVSLKLRGEPIASLAAALSIAAVLYRMWVKAGRPRGIRNAAAEAEGKEAATGVPPANG